jgi:hypothetical protein
MSDRGFKDGRSGGRGCGEYHPSCHVVGGFAVRAPHTTAKDRGDAPDTMGGASWLVSAAAAPPQACAWGPCWD